MKNQKKKGEAIGLVQHKKQLRSLHQKDCCQIRLQRRISCKESEKKPITTRYRWRIWLQIYLSQKHQTLQRFRRWHRKPSKKHHLTFFLFFAQNLLPSYLNFCTLFPFFCITILPRIIFHACLTSDFSDWGWRTNTFNMSQQKDN